MQDTGYALQNRKNKCSFLPTVLEDPFQCAILDLELCEVREMDVELSLAATGEFEREVMHARLGPEKRRESHTDP